MKDLPSVSVVSESESVAAGGGDERVVVVVVFGDPCLKRVGGEVDGCVDGEDLPDFVRDVV